MISIKPSMNIVIQQYEFYGGVSIFQQPFHVYSPD